MIKIKVTNKIGVKINSFIQQYELDTGNKMTKTEIAKRLNVSRQSLQTLINTPNPTIESLLKIAYIINCSPLDLIEYQIMEK